VTAHELGISLYWLPLGAGGRVVRLSGLAFEAIAARLASRGRLDLYHSALEVRTRDARFVIEVMPYAWGATARRHRGVVAEGPVASPRARRVGLFRYELRCWRDGLIVDVDAAVASPLSTTDDPDAAARLLDLVALVPMPTWGRDELDAGEMWTSNSVVSWLLAQAGAFSGELRPPAGGRAPGWDAGLRVAARELGARTPVWASDRAAERASSHSVALATGASGGPRSA
jgi:hypothetical protein